MKGDSFYLKNIKMKELQVKSSIVVVYNSKSCLSFFISIGFYFLILTGYVSSNELMLMSTQDDIIAAKDDCGIFQSVKDSVSAGVKALVHGNSDCAVNTLTSAAKKGNIAAKWKLGKMYHDGIGVNKDEYKAYQNFSQIVEDRADISPDSQESNIVSQSLVIIGNYYLTGIKDSPVKTSPTHAIEMFHYAATYYNYADAQYNIGRIYADALAGKKDNQQAVRWFTLAANQGHIKAQARLGQILFTGDGVPRQASRGLMWMQLAQEKADSNSDPWIVDMAENANKMATDEEKKLCDTYMLKKIRIKK